MLNGEYVISDFGTSKVILDIVIYNLSIFFILKLKVIEKNLFNPMSVMKGLNLSYIPPEKISDNAIIRSDKDDIFALGLTLL